MRIVRNFVSENISLISIVLLALLLRMAFFTGNIRGDAIQYVESALLLSQGDSPFTAWSGSSRIGLYFPVSFLFLILKPSELTVIIFPILTSMSSVILIYGIGKLQVSKAAGLTAAFIWAIWPLDIFLASQLLPDGPMATMSLFSVYFWLLSFKSSRKRFFLLLSAFFISWAILIKPLALIVVIFFAFYYFFQNFPLLRNWVADLLKISSKRAMLIIIAIPLLLIYFVDTQPANALLTLTNTSSDLFQLLITGDTHIDFSDVRITQSYLFVYLTPLLLITFVSLLLNHERSTNVLLAWAGFVILYYEWGTINEDILLYKPINNFVEARNFLIASAPVVILLGIYLSKSLESKHLDWLIPKYVPLYAVSAFLLKPTINLLDQNALIQIARNALFLLTILSPFYYFGNSKKQNMLISFALLFLISVILLVPTPPDHYSFFEQSRDLFKDWNVLTRLYE